MENTTIFEKNRKTAKKVFEKYFRDKFESEPIHLLYDFYVPIDDIKGSLGAIRPIIFKDKSLYTDTLGTLFLGIPNDYIVLEEMYAITLLHELMHCKQFREEYHSNIISYLKDYIFETKDQMIIEKRMWELSDRELAKEYRFLLNKYGDNRFMSCYNHYKEHALKTYE